MHRQHENSAQTFSAFVKCRQDFYLRLFIFFSNALRDICEFRATKKKPDPIKDIEIIA